MKTNKNERDRCTVSLVGLATGSRKVEETFPNSFVPGLPTEYQCDISVSGTIQKLGGRVLIDVAITTDATLICDRSLETYLEPIHAELALECKFDNELALSQREEEVRAEGPKGLFEDAREADISEEIRQELFLALPMKRVAPQHRGLSIEDIHPDVNDRKDETSSEGIWDALKKMK